MGSVGSLDQARQRGVALVYAMLMLAICAGLMFPRMSEQSVAIAHTANLVDAAQAATLADGLDAWAAAVLAEDRRRTSVDHEGELWHAALVVPAERATISGRLRDLRGRFNLNALIDKSGQDDALHIERFARLLGNLELPVALADVVLDWIDGDDVPRLPDGAESAVYVRNAPAYRAANQRFVSVSELRLLAGMTPAAYAILQPHVAVLDADAAINVNTATEAVLLSLADGLNRSAAREFVTGRQARPVRGLADLARWPLFSAPGLQTQGLVGVSDWFVLHAEITLPRATLDHAAVFERSDAGTRRVRVWSGRE